MPFVPRFEAKGISPVVDNLMTLVSAQIEDALVWANGGTAFPAPYTGFAQVEKAQRLDSKYPFLGVYSGVTDFLPAAEELVRQRHTIYLDIQIVGPEASELKQMVETYVRAVDMIIRSCAEADLSAGLSTNGYSPLIWDVTRIELSNVLIPRIREHKYIVGGRLTLLLEVWEQ
jgi:hypothetical protein